MRERLLLLSTWLLQPPRQARPCRSYPEQEMTSFRSPRKNHVVASARDPWLRNKYNDALWFNLSRSVSLSAVKSAACA